MLEYIMPILGAIIAIAGLYLITKSKKYRPPTDMSDWVDPRVRTQTRRSTD